MAQGKENLICHSPQSRKFLREPGTDCRCIFHTTGAMVHFACKKRHFLYALHYWKYICSCTMHKKAGFCACSLCIKRSIFCERALFVHWFELYGFTMQAVCKKTNFFGSPQRHTLWDRRPSTAAYPACWWAIGTRELKMYNTMGW